MFPVKIPGMVVCRRIPDERLNAILTEFPETCVLGVLNNYTLDGLVAEIERQRFGQERRKKTQGNDRDLLINAVLLTGSLSGC